jgi:hypothetical protein
MNHTLPTAGHFAKLVLRKLRGQALEAHQRGDRLNLQRLSGLAGLPLDDQSFRNECGRNFRNPQVAFEKGQRRDAVRSAALPSQLSRLQAESALTQAFDRPVTGRCFFEEAIRESLDKVGGAARLR